MKQTQSSVILIYNGQKQLALQLRSSTDNKYPNHWDFSAAGGIEPKEDPHQAALRELQEEIGIQTSLKFIQEIDYQDNHSHDHLYIFKGNYQGQFVPDPKEVDKVKFFSQLQIQSMLDSDEKFHPEFPFLWNKGLIY